MTEGELHRLIDELEATPAAVDAALVGLSTAEVAELTAARRANVPLLRTLGANQLRRTAMLEAVGEITVGQLVRMWRQHDAGHLRDIAALCGRIATLR